MNGTPRSSGKSSRLIIRGTGPARRVYLTDRVTQVGTIRLENERWYGFHLDGTPVTWTPVRNGRQVKRTERVMIEWARLSSWGDSPVAVAERARIAG